LVTGFSCAEIASRRISLAAVSTKRKKTSAGGDIAKHRFLLVDIAQMDVLSRA
jgi:hypothetical protein